MTSKLCIIVALCLAGALLCSVAFFRFKSAELTELEDRRLELMEAQIDAYRQGYLEGLALADKISADKGKIVDFAIVPN